MVAPGSIIIFNQYAVNLNFISLNSEALFIITERDTSIIRRWYTRHFATGNFVFGPFSWFYVTHYLGILMDERVDFSLILITDIWNQNAIPTGHFFQ